MPETRGLTTAPDGGIYWFVYPFHETFYYLDDNGVPQPYPYCKASPKGVININKDWLDKCGIEYSMFMTPEQLKDALVAFRDNAELLLGEDAAELTPEQRDLLSNWNKLDAADKKLYLELLRSLNGKTKQ